MRVALLLLFSVGLGLGSGSSFADDSNGPPVLDKITLRDSVERYETIYPTFYFHAPGGDVVELHRRIVWSNSANQNFNPVSRIDIDPLEQKKGAVWVGSWGCGPEPYTTRVSAYLLDRRGNTSNSVEYTIVCKGSAELAGGE